MKKFYFFLFLILISFSIIGIVSTLNLSPTGQVYGGGQHSNRAYEILVSQRMATPYGKHMPIETVMKKGALQDFGRSPCPKGYGLANINSCRNLPCIQTNNPDYFPGKLCKPDRVNIPEYPTPY